MARIKDLTEMTAAGLATSDEFVVNDISENKEKRMKYSSLLSKILGGKALGGAADADITQNNATQTLKNKKLELPSINSNATTNATSEDLNRLHASNATAAEMNNLIGSHSNIQSQLNGKADAALVRRGALYYAVEKKADARGGFKITEASIRAALELPPDRRISEYVSIQIWKKDTVPWTLQSIVSTVGLTPAENGALEVITVNGLTPEGLFGVFVTCYDIKYVV